MRKADSSFISYYSWPIGIVIFFALLAAFNVYLAKQAFNNHPDSVTESPYESGLKYQEIVDQLTHAKTLGLLANVEIGAAQANGLRPLSISLQAADSSTLEQIKSVVVHAIRPSTAKLDAQASLLPNMNSKYEFAADISLAAPGYYLLEILIEFTQGNALIKESIVVKP